VPFVVLDTSIVGNQLTIGFESVAGAIYVLEARATWDQSWVSTETPIYGTGSRIEIPVNVDEARKFLRLVAAPQQ